MEQNGNTIAIAALVGMFIPLIISFLKQVNLARWANLLIAAAVCVGAGVLTVWARGELHWANFAIVLAAIATVAEATYAAYWRDSGVEAFLAPMLNIFNRKDEPTG